MSKKAATPWGPAELVEELKIPQRAGERHFASLVQLLETQKGERLVLEVHLLDGYILNKTQGTRHDLRPLGDVLPIIEAGGVFEYAKRAGMLK